MQNEDNKVGQTDRGRLGWAEMRLVVFDNQSALRKLLLHFKPRFQRDPTYKIQEAKHYN